MMLIDTGTILSAGAKFRNLLVANTSSFATSENRLRIYSLNLEHSQTEANGEVRDASFVDIYSIKGEGNTPMLWLRGASKNISVLGFGGDPTAFPYNFTQPPDFEQLSASLFRVDAEVTGVSLALLLDHGFGASDYWPPTGGGCAWKHYYPYPGEEVPFYPFGTWPNNTMWTCWFGKICSTKYYWMISDGLGEDGVHSVPMDKPVLWTSPK
jgi:hypothetical protein